ncbi:MAG: cytochrome c-type biogenesis CcmF C-terminal domain-containing protein, partial [Actinomycetota bacterium]
AFARSLVGPMYLAFLALVLVGGFGLIAARAWQLRSEGSLDAVASREAAFLGNNLALVGLTFLILLGTIFPLLVEATSGRQVSVGEPYFIQATVPLFLLLLFLAGVGPLFPWRRGSREQLRRRLTIPAVCGAAVVVVLVAAGVRNLGAMVALGLAGFVAVANGGEVVRGVRAFARSSGRSVISAVPSALTRNRRLYGGLVVHVGVAVVAAAITVSTSFARQVDVTLSRGEGTILADYDLRYEGMRVIPEPHRTVVLAQVAVSREGQELGSLTPSLNLYPGSEPIGSPSIRYGTLNDLYSSVVGFDENGERASFRFFLNPGVAWLWVGGAIMALGGLLALWPGRRYRTTVAPASQTRDLVGVA